MDCEVKIKLFCSFGSDFFLITFWKKALTLSYYSYFLDRLKNLIPLGIQTSHNVTSSGATSSKPNIPTLIHFSSVTLNKASREGAHHSWHNDSYQASLSFRFTWCSRCESNFNSDNGPGIVSFSICQAFYSFGSTACDSEEAHSCSRDWIIVETQGSKFVPVVTRAFV